MSTVREEWEMACPDCESDEAIDIYATVSVRLCPNGTDADESSDGGSEWADDSNAVCQNCGKEGKVSEFRLGNQTHFYVLHRYNAEVTDVLKVRADNEGEAIEQYHDNQYQYIGAVIGDPVPSAERTKALPDDNQNLPAGLMILQGDSDA